MINMQIHVGVYSKRSDQICSNRYKFVNILGTGLILSLYIHIYVYNNTFLNYVPFKIYKNINFETKKRIYYTIYVNI